MKRFALILTVVFVAMGVGIGVLAWRVIHGLDRQQETNHWVVAGTVFTECERELDAFLAREEDRPFGQYAFFYLPPDQVPGTAALSRSPLADAPEDPWVEGYFQVDETKGFYNTPAVPRNGDLLELARKGFGYDGPETNDRPFDVAVGSWLGIDVLRRPPRERPRLAQKDGPARPASAVDHAGMDQAAKVPVAQGEDVQALVGEVGPANDAAGSSFDAPAVQQHRTIDDDKLARHVPSGKGKATQDEEAEGPQEWTSLSGSYNRASSVDVRNAQRDRQVKVQVLNPNEASRYGNYDNNVFLERALVGQNAQLQDRLAQVQQDGVGSEGSGPESQGEAIPAVPALQQVQEEARRAQVYQLPPEHPLKLFSFQDEMVRNLVDNDLLGVQARIFPFAARRMDRARLVLERTVEVGPRRYRQGMVMDVAAFVDVLRASLEEGALAGKARLAWSWAEDPAPEATAGMAYRYRHGLPEPFDGLAVHLGLPVLEGEAVAGRRFVLLLAGGLLVALGIGFVAIHRMVGTRLEFARRRGDFVSAVTHELKTPLTSIRMYGEMLAEDMVPDEAKRHDYYRTITAEGERLGRLVDNVLELSKLEHGSRAVQLVAGDPREVVDEALQMLTPHAAGKGFRLELDAPAAGTPQAVFDRDALLQVVVNLVDNAVKFSAGADDKVVSLRFDALEHGIELRIRDRGPGVPEAQLKKIFEPFYRGERELTRRTKGTGIGLALARGLIDRMGGALKARNHPEGGFEVSVRLALA